MGFFDLIIVYLAFGAPFAVSDYLQRNDLIRAFVVFIFWPAAAWRSVRKRISPPEAVAFDERSARIFEKLQREIDGRTNHVVFRDAFDRYVGLSNEIRREESPLETKSAELLRISGSENTAAAAAALSRRNAVRLRRHHNDARERFLELIESSQEFNATVLALELATYLEDDEAQQYLNRAIGHDRTEGESWEQRKQQKPTERIAA
ncbi:MAG TPA: hypothetical protein VJL58_12150 [Pyrinomonadaceae bacterium]|nr:hypothetical protein [Pyrinomonadaceae bacterium]